HARLHRANAGLRDRHGVASRQSGFIVGSVAHADDLSNRPTVEDRLRAELAVTLAPEEKSEVEAVVGEIRRALEADAFQFGDEEGRADFEAQLDTLTDQLRSPKPRRSIVGRASWALRWTGGIAIAVWWVTPPGRVP